MNAILRHDMTVNMAEISRSYYIIPLTRKFWLVLCEYEFDFALNCNI